MYSGGSERLRGAFRSSVGRVSLDSVDVTAEDVARIPRTNLRVPRDEFIAVWVAAERCQEEQARCGVSDWYAGAVAVTCRWLARGTSRPSNGLWEPARSPVTKRTDRAYEELIDAELIEAEKLDLRRPRPDWLERRPGWSEGIVVTLRWVWQHSGPPPLKIERPAAG